MRIALRWQVVVAATAVAGVLITAVTVRPFQGHSSPGTRGAKAGISGQPLSAWQQVATAPATATQPSVTQPSVTQPSAAQAGPPVGPLPRQLFVPDLIAAEPAGLTPAQLAGIGRLPGVRTTLLLDGGVLRLNGTSATVIGADPQALRAWTPPPTAADVPAWGVLGAGGLLGRGSARASGQVTAVGKATLSMPARLTPDLGIPGVDAVVDAQRSGQLGLAKGIAVLINAPGADLHALMPKVRALLGPHGQVRNLVPVFVYGALPVTVVPTGVIPANYLQLYQEAATRYCPGLSWTVLAAIGEIESGHGANDGPSSAGALGPMQFLPSTWAVYGIDGFDDTGKPNIMNPLDAVPSAARLLCANGAVSGPAGLRAAIFAYNHADWYVAEVLDLAAEYGSAYR